jgi:AraC-like DNA-binding protein
MAQSGWNGRIFLDTGLILYVGPGAGADPHAHHAVQLVWSADGPFDVVIGGRHEQRTAALIPANSEHSLDATGHRIALLLVESHGTRGTALDAAAERMVAGRELAHALAAVAFPEKVAASQVAGWTDGVLNALGVQATRSPLSSVSRRAIEYIEQHLDGVPRVEDVARTLSLSTTRITHLFSDEVGIPFRRFVLWTRIKRAVITHQSGSDLTTSAIAAGFSDAAHFSRTFRAMFGLSPSLVLTAAEARRGPIDRSQRAKHDHRGRRAQIGELHRRPGSTPGRHRAERRMHTDGRSRPRK